MGPLLIPAVGSNGHPVILSLASTWSIIAGRGMRKLIAVCLQSKTQALQCQHSSEYLISGGSPLFTIRKTSVGQISAQTPQALHFSLMMIGGITPS
jgi:hypothetical protein